MSKIEILNILIKIHDEGSCCCDLTSGGTGLCTAGAYLEGCRDLYDTLRDIEEE